MSVLFITGGMVGVCIMLLWREVRRAPLLDEDLRPVPEVPPEPQIPESYGSSVGFLLSIELELLATASFDAAEVYAELARSEEDPADREMAGQLAEWRRIRGRLFNVIAAEREAVEEAEAELYPDIVGW